MSSSELHVEDVALDRLFGSSCNPRRNDAAVEHVAASIRRFGFQQPIVAKPSGEVIVGNTRLKAAKLLGLQSVPVVWFVSSEIEATAYQIGDNRPHDYSEWCDADLAPLLDRLRREDALEGVGFSDEDIDRLIAELDEAPSGVGDDDEVAPSESPITERGDMWHLGQHRLLCGDSTYLRDVLRVMDRDRAALVATDPPYLVDYTGERPDDTGKDWSDKYREIDIQDADAFLRSFFTNVMEVLAPNAAIYCWHAHKRAGDIQRIWRELGILDHQQIVWVKPSAVFGRVNWHFRHEPCVMGWRKGQKPEHDGKHQHDSVWEVDWEGKARVVGNEHPCLHPDSLVLTGSGYRPIHTIQVGEQVLAADGKFHSVVDVSSHPYTSPELFRIQAVGHQVPTLASDNHPFLVSRPNRAIRCINGGTVAWLRADEMRIGDYTMTPVISADGPDPLPDRDEEYWFLFGLYLAQGSLQRLGHDARRYPTYHFQGDRQDLVARIQARWRSTTVHDRQRFGRADLQGLTVMASEPGLGAEFEELAGQKDHAKHIAPIVFALPRHKRLAVLQGWLSGEVRRYPTGSDRYCCTTSGDLAAHLELLGESVGYSTRISRKRSYPEYELRLDQRGESDVFSGGRYVNHEGRDYRCRRVKSIERVPYDGEVWNLSVEGCPSFQTSVGMSHNTQKPIELFGRPILKHTRKGDVVFEPFSGSGSQIMAAERTGRRCRAIEISPAFVDAAVKRWEKATARQATLDGDDRSFTEIAAERAAT